MMRQEEQSKSTDRKQSGEENEMRKHQRSITESTHYNQLLQLIDYRWDKKHKETQVGRNKEQREGKRVTWKPAKPSWEAMRMDDPPLRGDRQEQTMEEMIRTQKGAVMGQRPDTPMGRSYKGHGKEDEKDDMDPHQHRERGDNVGKKTDQHPEAEKNQSESDWKGRKGRKTRKGNTTAPYQYAPRWDANSEQSYEKRKNNANKEGKKSS